MRPAPTAIRGSICGPDAGDDVAVSVSFRQLPNLITVFRLALIAPLAAALLHHHGMAALLLLFAAALSDAADGFLAKHFSWQTAVGAMLDPIADKLLIATVFVTLAVQGGVPVWLAAAAVGRDLVIIGGACVYRLRFAVLPVRPTVISKLNTLCQLLYIVSVVARQEFARPPAWLVTVLGAMVFVTVATSGLDYVLTFARRARREQSALREQGPRQARRSA